VEIAADDLDASAAYRLLVGIVVPRPIAWITTLSRLELVNAAPFSCYTFVCNDPPMLAINIGRRDGELKDTARNIDETGEFVVNVVSEDLVEAMHATSAETDSALSEVDALRLELARSRVVRTPRLARSPVSLECRLDRVIELGRFRNGLVLGQVVHWHINDTLYDNGKIDSEKLRPVARLAGGKYARLADYLNMPPADLTRAAAHPSGSAWPETASPVGSTLGLGAGNSLGRSAT
jgi:flavin reductase (DIM6/NTAB) family NADH-FMN oxidoreductase RutF